MADSERPDQAKDGRQDGPMPDRSIRSRAARSAARFLKVRLGTSVLASYPHSALAAATFRRSTRSTFAVDSKAPA